MIICGKLTNYGGTPETSSKEAYIYSLNGQTSIDQGPVFGVEKAQISVSASATSAVIKVTGNVAWTASTAINALTLSPASGQGAGEITATFPGSRERPQVRDYRSNGYFRTAGKLLRRDRSRRLQVPGPYG